MKLVRWVRFEWDLRALPAQPPAREGRYRFRRAARGDEHAVRETLLSAFSLDADWNDALVSLRDSFQAQVERAFEDRDVPCIVLTCGARIVGVSLLSFDPADANHLISGPAILNEYRNRGLGTSLLWESLAALRDAGLERAFGLTKAVVPTAKFLYTKYESTQAAIEYEADLVG